MTQDEIMEMAKQAGFFIKDNEAYSPSSQEDHELTPFLEAFSTLVEERERERILGIVKEGLWDGVGLRQHLEQGDKHD